MNSAINSVINFACQFKSLSIKAATIEDVQDILIIQKGCALAEWSLENYLVELKRENSLLLVAKVKAGTVGFLSARLSTGEVDLLNIGVQKPFRKKGIGEALLNDLLERIEDKFVKAIWLEVRKSNLGAIAFYHKNGFEQTQMRKNFYAQPVEDALVMKYDLSKPFLKSPPKT